MVPCASCRGPMNPLQGSGVSERSRCGAAPILPWTDEPSTGIGRVGSLAGEPSAGIGVVPCASCRGPMNPLQGSGVSERSRCGAVRILAVADEPSTGIGRVGSLAGEPSAGIGVVPCASLSSPMNPLQGSGVSERSRCGAAPILPHSESAPTRPIPVEGSSATARMRTAPQRERSDTPDPCRGFIALGCADPTPG